MTIELIWYLLLSLVSVSLNKWIDIILEKYKFELR